MNGFSWVLAALLAIVLTMLMIEANRINVLEHRVDRIERVGVAR